MRTNGADFGVVGLGVMGRNLALNVERHGYTVAVYNRTTKRTEAFVAERPERRWVPSSSLRGFVASLAAPRRILAMVKAGHATDAVLKELFPLLAGGDVVIDGSNAHYLDTDRRIEQAEASGLLYLGAGVSGGAEGALRGPAIMPGGTEHAYDLVGSLLESIAAEGPAGPCCSYLGPGSAGHYVKIVHNGIEYAVMQVLAEVYDLLHRGDGRSATEIADVFAAWNAGWLDSYLVEISERILRTTDGDTGEPLVDAILDQAEQKGTGKWSSQAALDLGTPAPMIAAAVYARFVSARKDERSDVADRLAGPSADGKMDLGALGSAALLAVMAAYAEGFRQLGDASRERGYGFELAEIARIWMDGCIIRSRLLEPIRSVLLEAPDVAFLLAVEPFTGWWSEHQDGLRRTIAQAHHRGIPVPAMSAALNAIDAYRARRLPANLIQAQRDAFGAHGYRRTDRDGTFRTDWKTES